MIGRIMQWNRLVLPPWWAIAFFAFPYLTIELLYLYVGWWINLPGDVKELKLFIQMRWGFVTAGAVFLGLYRLSFHPFYRPEYRTWLSCTPWTVAKPLPLGPVHLIPQDVIILALLTPLMLSTGIELLWPAFAFLFASEFAMAVTLVIAGQRWTAYGLLFCLSVGASLVQAGAWGLLVVMLVYPLAYWARLRCLARFPWPTMDDANGSLQAGVTIVARGIAGQRAAKSPSLGFPYEYLAPKHNAPSISLAEGTALSLLAGTWAHACIANATTANQRTSLSFFTCIAPILAAMAIRLMLYCGAYWPPISLLGRLATGRFVIPRYDRVFVAPLLALIVALPGCFLFQEMSPAWGMPLVLILGMWLILNLGPRLLDWRLTGGHRLSLTLYRDRRFVEP